MDVPSNQKPEFSASVPTVLDLVSTNLTASTEARDESLALVELAVLTLIFAFTVMGNSTVLLALATRRSKMTRMYYFLLHLCVSDLITAFLTVLPQLGWDATYRFQGGNIACKSVKFGQLLGPYLSSYVLVVTAVDRYQAICFPLSNCSWTPTKSKLLICAAWVAALLCCLPQVFIFSYQEVSPEVFDCWGTYAESWGLRAYVTWYGVSVFFVPLTVLSFTYVCICRSIWRNLYLKRKSSDAEAWKGGRAYRFKGTAQNGTKQDSSFAGPRSHSVRGLSRAKIKTVKITVVVIALYVVCSSPFICVQMWMYWSPHVDMANPWINQFHPADVQKLTDSDELCRRFIRQKRRNVEDALAMAKAALCWRKTFEVNDITVANLPQVYFDFGAMFPLGKDKYGSQIIVHRVRLHRKNEKMAKHMKRFLVFWVEKLLYELDHVRITFILDCNGSGYANLDMDLISFLISLFKEYYPWALGFIMVYDMPWIFNTAWKVVKSWLPAEGADRIKFVDRETITNYVPRENLPEYMGGKEKLPFREYTWDDVDFLVNAASPKVISERIPRTKEIEEFYRSRFGMFEARSTTATEDAVTLIKVEPETDLLFNADEPDINKHIGSVVLTNTSDTHVAFKIKTNNIDGYKVKPFFGIIPLNSTVSVNVAQNPGSEFHASDKLLIMTTGIDTLEITPRELIDHWRAVAKESIKEHRLRCVNPGLTTSKISPETKEQCLKSLPLTARQAALAKEKSYQSFCPPVQPSPTGTNQLELIQDVVGNLQAKIGDVHQEVNKISRRQEHLVVCMGATLILLLGNLVVLFVVKSCQSAREWYC